jgi:hypothetical protein
MMIIIYKISNLAFTGKIQEQISDFQKEGLTSLKILWLSFFPLLVNQRNISKQQHWILFPFDLIL